MNISHQWLQTYFSKPLPSPEEIEATLSTHSFEPEGMESLSSGDTLYDFDVLPNRAHDCLCHRGFAREVAVLFNRADFSASSDYSTDSKNISGEGDSPLSVTINSPEKCSRYSARVIENISVKESPQWLKDRLESIGQRPINSIVDATNYILFEMGQPLHAFDFDKMGNKIVVRNAKDGEEMKTLDNKEIKLSSLDLVISDENNLVLALAGVKGGVAAQVDEATVSVVLEAANFDPISARKTSRSHNIFTDASKRYENELSVHLVEEAMDRLTGLILELSGNEKTRIYPVSESYKEQVEKWGVNLQHSHVEDLLGISIKENTVVNILTSLGCNVEKTNLDTKLNYLVTPPLERLDLKIPEDLIEEVGRIYGYDKLPNISVSSIPYTPKVNPLIFWNKKISNMLSEKGFNEIVTYTFTDKGDVEMSNALAQDKRFARTNLIDGAEKSRLLNAQYIDIIGVPVLTLFEIGSTFKDGNEEFHLSLTIDPLSKKARKKGSVDAFLEIEKELSASIFKGFNLGDTIVATHENNLIREYNLESIYKNIETADSSYEDIYEEQDSHKKYDQYVPFSIFPYTTRDIAVWLPEKTDSEELLSTLTQDRSDLLVKEPRLVDTFSKEGRTSYAYRLIFQARDRTLTDEEITPIMENITTLCEGSEWEVR